MHKIYNSMKYFCIFLFYLITLILPDISCTITVCHSTFTSQSNQVPLIKHLMLNNAYIHKYSLLLSLKSIELTLASGFKQIPLHASLYVIESVT